MTPSNQGPGDKKDDKRGGPRRPSLGLPERLRSARTKNESC